MEKKCKVIGLLENTAYESDQRVYSRGGCSKAMKAGNPLNQVVRKYEKIVVVGAIGQTERENRDNMRVVARGGVYTTSKLTFK